MFVVTIGVTKEQSDRSFIILKTLIWYPMVWSQYSKRKYLKNSIICLFFTHIFLKIFLLPLFFTPVPFIFLVIQIFSTELSTFLFLRSFLFPYSQTPYISWDFHFFVSFTNFPDFHQISSFHIIYIFLTHSKRIYPQLFTFCG